MVYIQDNLDKIPTSLFGGKAIGLAELKKIGASVPETFCLAIEKKEIDTLVNDQEVSKQIEGWISGIEYFDNLILRSSNPFEDSLITSSAGLYESRVINIQKENFLFDIMQNIYEPGFK